MTYDFLLVDWINLALHKDSLKNVLDSIRHNHKIKVAKFNKSNSKYIEKILREEVVKQFNDWQRPILEVILNAIDARPKNFDGEHEVKIELNKGNIVVKDNGTSLSLDQILRLLIIPFNTEKNGIEEIGRFGVGFLSNFYYCTISKHIRIIVKTSTKDEQYLIQFYSTDKTVANLRMKLIRKRKTKKEGTEVKIKGITYSVSGMNNYLEMHLSRIPSYIAKLFIFKECLNREKEDWITIPVELKALGKTIQQLVAFRRTNENKITLTSQGVLVRKFNIEQFLEIKENDDDRNIGAVISFPSAVKVVEGRDEFKIDENYEKCINAVFRAFEIYIDKHEKTDNFILNTTDFFPKLVAAFSINNITDIPNLGNIQKALLPDKKYVLAQQSYYHLYPFLGKIMSDITFPASIQACSFWKDLYMTKRTFINDILKPVQNFTLNQWEYPSTKKIESQFFYDPCYQKDLIEKNEGNRCCILSNLELFRKKLYDLRPRDICFVNIPNAGKQTMIFLKDEFDHVDLYINIANSYVQGEFDPIKAYTILSDCFVYQDIKPIYNKYLCNDQQLENDMRASLLEMNVGE